MADTSLNIVVKLVDQASSGLKGFADNLDKTADSIDKNTQKAQTFTKAVTAIGAAVGAYALNQFADFEKTMSGVDAVLQPTREEFAQLGETVKQLGKDTIYTQGEIAGAVEELGKQGISTQAILTGAIEATASLAAAAGTTLETAATISGDAMNIFGIQAEDMKNVVNQITGVANASKLSVEDYALAIAQGGGIAKQSGVPFEEFNSVLAATANYFKGGSDQGTSFKTFMQSLAPTAAPAIAAMEEIGFSAYDATGNLLPMRDIAQRLQESLKGLSDEAKNQVLKTIFGSDSARMAGAIAEAGAAGLDKVTEAIQKTDAAAQAATRLDNFWGDLEKLKGTLDVLATDLGAKISEVLRPAIRYLTDALNDLSTWFKALSPGMQKFIEYAGIAALAVGGLVFAVGAIGIILPSIMGAISAITGAIAFLTSPIGLVIAAIVALGIAYETNFLGMKDAVAFMVNAAKPLFDKIVAGIMSVVNDVMKYVNILKDTLIPVWNEIQPHVMRFLQIIQEFFGGTFQNIITILSGAFDIIKGIFQVAFNVIAGIFTLFIQLITGDWSGMWETMKTMVSGAWEGIVTILTGVWEVLKGLFSQLGNILLTIMDLLWTGILATVTVKWNQITGFISGAWETLKTVFSVGSALIQIGWDTFTSFLYTKMKNVWDDIKQVISNGIDWAIEKINYAISLANQLPGVDIAPIGTTNTAPAIAGARASGGPVEAGRTYLVGEQGMEYFTPSSNGYITPNDQIGGTGVTINFGGVSVRNDNDIKSLAREVSDVLTRNLQLYKQRTSS